MKEFKNFDYPYSRELNEKEIKESEKLLKEWINKVNDFAIIPILSTNYPYLSKCIEKHQNNEFWNNLGYDNSSLKHFEIEPIDPSQGIFLVDIDFLISKKGNEYCDFKTDRVNRKIENGEKMSIPFYEFYYDSVGEGNHRIKKMKELGYKYVPIKVFWK